MRSSPRRIAVAAATALGTGLLAMSLATAPTGAQGADGEKTVICHAQGPGSPPGNGYVRIVVDPNAANAKDRLSDHQQHDGTGTPPLEDIIFGPGDPGPKDLGNGNQVSREDCSVTEVTPTTLTPTTLTPTTLTPTTLTPTTLTPTTVLTDVEADVETPDVETPAVLGTTVVRPAELPRTGQGMGPFVGLGVILLAAGTAMAISRRKAITSA